MLNTINSFVDTMIEEKDKFESIQNEISNTQNCIQDTITNLKSKQSDLIESVKGSSLADEDLVSDVIESTAKLLQEKISQVDKDIKEGLSGMTFIEKFEKKFTVSVFGKVKAGKSYLGNFVMGQGLKKAGIKTSYDKLGDISVTVYDKGKLTQNTKLETAKEDEDDGFAVNMNEATSTIQYFDLGGITWFDTPGVGSITKENEELAQEYIKNSDLVVYASTSDAAGTTQDFDELRNLFNMGKPILLLLTQSDETDFDVDDDGNEITTYVAKSDIDRKDMETYMVETMEKNGIQDILKLADILTVSVFLANEGLKNKDQSLFDQSNMGIFLNKLVEITKNDSAEMKRKTPSTRINKTIDDIIKNLETVETELDSYFGELDKSSEELKQKKEHIVQNVRFDVNLKVSNKLTELSRDVEQGRGSISGSSLQSTISNIVQDSVTTICSKEINSQMDKISALEIPICNVGSLEMKKGSIEHEHRRSKRVERDPQGFIENVKSIFGKTYYSTKTETYTESVSFDIGVNISEIQRNIMRELESVFEQNVNAVLSNIFDNYYTPIKNLEIEINKEIKNTIKSLEGLKM